MPPTHSVASDLERAEALIRRADALMDEAERILDETGERLHHSSIVVPSLRNTRSKLMTHYRPPWTRAKPRGPLGPAG
jgi:hypothetical protein